MFPNSLGVCYITKFPQRMLYYQIPSSYLILPNSHNVCYITKFPQHMLYYQIPQTYVMLQNLCPQQMLREGQTGKHLCRQQLQITQMYVTLSNNCMLQIIPNVCYKQPQHMLFYQILPTYVILPNSLSLCYIIKFPQRMLYYKIPSAYVMLLNTLSVCYITKFPQRMLYYQIPSAYVMLPNSPNVCYITKFMSATNVVRAGKRGNICVSDKWMYPQQCVLVCQGLYTKFERYIVTSKVIYLAASRLGKYPPL